MKTNELEKVKLNTENDLSAATASAEQKESTLRDSEPLAAAPCSPDGAALSEHDERFLNAIRWMEIVQEYHSK